jgi:hypothetical protein
MSLAAGDCWAENFQKPPLEREEMHRETQRLEFTARGLHGVDESNWTS